MEWRKYVPVATRLARARREMNRRRKAGKDVRPVEIEGRTIARSFWGKRWCEHLESFSDYANRLPRGRAYVRNGSVCHLAIRTGRIEAIVAGSELYDVAIRVRKLKAGAWTSVKRRCSGQIGSLLELLQGRLSRQVMSVVTDRERGLFPKPGEIGFDCSCPDWASMCKHVAAVLYGVGARLDDDPESLFLLRGVDSAELIATGMTLPDEAASDDALADDALAGIFGIDLDTGVGGDGDGDAGDAPPPAPTAPARQRKRARGRAAPTTGESPASSTAKVRDLPAATASAGRSRKAAPRTTRGKQASATAAPRKRAATTRTGTADHAVTTASADHAASAASAGRARPRTSSAARGKASASSSSTRKRATTEVQEAPATRAARTDAERAGTARTGTARTAARLPTRLTGAWVARLRRRHRLSVAEFADRLGVSPMTVYRWEATSGALNLQARPRSALAALYRQSGKGSRRE